MKFVALTAVLPAVAALSNGGYLSQLGAGTYEGVNGGAKAGSFFADPAETASSPFSAGRARIRATPPDPEVISELNKGTYERVNGKKVVQSAFFQDPAEVGSSPFSATRPKINAPPPDPPVISELNKGTYERVNGKKIVRGAFFQDPAEVGSSPFSATRPKINAPPPDPPVVSQLNQGTYEGLNGGGKRSYAFFPDPAGTPPNWYASGNKAPPAPQPQAVAPVRPKSPPTYNPPAPTGPSQAMLNLWSSQVSVELAASQLYLSASIWFRERNMNGMAAWMLEESDEERGHGLAILEQAMQANYPVRLKKLDAPKFDWQTPVQVWESILHAEQTNTQNLLKLAAAAEQCGEYGSVEMLKPLHEEQNEAETKVGGILADVRRGTPEVLQKLDYYLGLEAQKEAHH